MFNANPSGTDDGFTAQEATRRKVPKNHWLEGAGGMPFAGAAMTGGRLGVSQQAATRAPMLSLDFLSISPWRTTQRNACWRWSPGQLNRS
jgi:hypothetical protein